MPEVLPLRPSLGAYRFTTSLDGTQYLFSVRWNSRDNEGRGAWYFDVSEFDGTAILRGVKIVLGTYLGRWSDHPLLLRGVFVAQSSATVHADPGFDDLGVAVQVLYYNRADLAAAMLGAFAEAT